MTKPEREKNDLYKGTDEALPNALSVIEQHHKEHDETATGAIGQESKAREVAETIVPDKPKGFGAPENDGEEGEFVASIAPKHKPKQEPVITPPEQAEVDDVQLGAENIKDITPATAAEIEGSADQQRNSEESDNMAA